MPSKNILIISDPHFPYQHKDMFKFLRAVHTKYDIGIVKCSGDMADNHTASYHEIEYGTLSAEEEFKQTKKGIQKLAKMFPDMTVVLGNHCILNQRKAKTAGIPTDHLKSYNDVYGVNWNWIDSDYFKISNDLNCLLIHAMSANTLTNARIHAHATIQGHHHGTFGIEYFADTEVLRWSMTVGCMVDPKSPAFNYAKGAASKRPILGVGVIINGLPKLIPMQLNKAGRWNGRVQ